MHTAENPYVAISGTIGVGKSTLAKLVEYRFGLYRIEEAYKCNPFLEIAVQNPAQYAFQSEMWFLENKFRQTKRAQKRLTHQGVVDDAPIQLDVHAFGRALLKGPEFDLYFDVYQTLASQLVKPAIVVCLEANALSIMERIRLRGRPFEVAYTTEYIQRIADLNKAWIQESDIPAVYIQTDDLDIVHSMYAQKTVLGIIRKQLHL